MALKVGLGGSVDAGVGERALLRPVATLAVAARAPGIDAAERGGPVRRVLPLSPGRLTTNLELVRKSDRSHVVL